MLCKTNIAVAAWYVSWTTDVNKLYDNELLRYSKFFLFIFFMFQVTFNKQIWSGWNKNTTESDDFFFLLERTLSRVEHNPRDYEVRILDYERIFISFTLQINELILTLIKNKAMKKKEPFHKERQQPMWCCKWVLLLPG